MVKKIASYQKKFAIKLSFVLGHILKSHDNIILSRGTHRMAALSYPLYLGGKGAVPRLELFQSMHWFLRIWAALSVKKSVKKWEILLICFLNIVQRAMHICSFHSVYVACTRYTVPVSDQPLPLLPVLKLASLTILPEQLLSLSHAGPGDAFSVKSSSTSHPRPHRFALAAFWRQSAVCCFSLLKSTVMMNWFGNWKNQ